MSNIKVHLILVLTYPELLSITGIATRLELIFRDSLQKSNCLCLEAYWDKDCLHTIFRCEPKFKLSNLSNLVSGLKTSSSYHFKKEFPTIFVRFYKMENLLWSGGYFTILKDD